MPRRSKVLGLLLLTVLSGITSCRHSRCRDCIRGGDRLPDRGGLSDPVPPPIIPSRDSIPPASLPVTPGRSFEPLPAPELGTPRRDTFRPSETLPSYTDPLPRMLPPVLPVVPDSPMSVLPPSGDSNRLPEAVRSEYLPRLPLPDRRMLLEPVMPGTRSDLPEETLAPPIASSPLRPEIMPPPPQSRKEVLFPDDLPKSESKAPTGKSDPVATTDLPDSTRALGTGTDMVSVGRKPLVDGFDWLKNHGYRTVLYLHAPGADVTAIRELVEKRGLTFTTLAVTPMTLKAALEAFRKQIADRTSRPLYVCDDNGVRTGSLFYLYFRTAENLSDDQSRVRSGPLGLKDPSTSDEQNSFWLAIQDFLSKR